MSRSLHPVVLAGTIAGALDITAACTLSWAFGNPPPVVLRGIASGLLGPSARDGGAWTAALGLLLHFVIAFTAAAVYDAASRRWGILVRHAVGCGAAYGVAVYLVMNGVVVPLSRIGFRLPAWYLILTMVGIHIFCVGLPIALAVAWARGRRRDSGAALRA